MMKLRSSVDIDYSPLANFLSDRQWRLADEETERVMHLVLRKLGRCTFWDSTSQKILFPQIDLQTIDRLWIHHSHGRFGFSIQQLEAAKASSTVLTDSFGNSYHQSVGQRLGWLYLNTGNISGPMRMDGYRDYNHLIFSLDAPVGHLPVRVLWDIGSEFLCIDGERDRDYATAHAMDGLMLMSALFENP
jgi:hypothetical protein